MQDKEDTKKIVENKENKINIKQIIYILAVAIAISLPILFIISQMEKFDFQSKNNVALEQELISSTSTSYFNFWTFIFYFIVLLCCTVIIIFSICELNSQNINEE